MLRDCRPAKLANAEPVLMLLSTMAEDPLPAAPPVELRWAGVVPVAALLPDSLGTPLEETLAAPPVPPRPPAMSKLTVLPVT